MNDTVALKMLNRQCREFYNLSKEKFWTQTERNMLLNHNSILQQIKGKMLKF